MTLEDVKEAFNCIFFIGFTTFPKHLHYFFSCVAFIYLFIYLSFYLQIAVQHCSALYKLLLLLLLPFISDQSNY